MAQRTDIYDLGRLTLRPGEAHRLDSRVTIDDLVLGGQHYRPAGGETHVRVDVSRTTTGFALRLRFETRLEGPCMRCLEDAGQVVEVDSREVDQPGAGEELRSPYLEGGELDLRAWARDALALDLPDRIICTEDCRGLCAVCGANLNEAPDHAHDSAPDPRWSKLSELRFD